MNGYFQSIFNCALDNLVRQNIQIFRLTLPAFQFCGYTGSAVAMALALSLGVSRNLLSWVLISIMAAAGCASFSLAMLTKIITGEEKLIYYHHGIAVLGVTLLLLLGLDRPVLPYLDIMILGSGAFLTCGRIGCLMVGCCHGRPHHWGVCYRAEHAAAGFTPYYVGVRLFPIQMVELLWVLCVVVVGSALLLSGDPPGTALAWYIVAYGSGRFYFEFLRGDPERGYFWSFSAAQWTSLLLMVVVGVAELTGALPFHTWHLVVTTGMALVMVVIAFGRRFNPAPRYQLLQPRHVREFASILAQIEDNGRTGSRTESEAYTAPVLVGTTSLGIQLSAGTLNGPHGFIRHYTCSCHGTPLNKEAAETLAALVRQLRHITGTVDVIERKAGIFHLLMSPAEDAI